MVCKKSLQRVWCKAISSLHCTLETRPRLASRWQLNAPHHCSAAHTSSPLHIPHSRLCLLPPQFIFIRKHSKPCYHEWGKPENLSLSFAKIKTVDSQRWKAREKDCDYPSLSHLLSSPLAFNMESIPPLFTLNSKCDCALESHGVPVARQPFIAHQGSYICLQLNQRAHISSIWPI